MASKFLTGLYLTSAFVVFSQASYSQVAAEKAAPASLLPNAYGTVSLRQYMNYHMTEADVTRQEPIGQLRAVLGSTFFDGKFDANLTIAVSKKSQTTEMANRRPELNLALTAYDGFVSVSPSSTIYTPQGAESRYNGDAGIAVEKSIAAPTKLGAFAFKLAADVRGTFSSQKEDAVYKNDTNAEVNDEVLLGFGITGAQADDKGDVTIKGGKGRPDYTTNYVAEAKFSPAKFAKISTKVGTTMYRTFAENYLLKDDGSVAKSYVPSTVMEDYFILNYQASEKIGVSNTLLSYKNGFYQKRTDGIRYTNLVKLSYTL